MLVGKNRLIDIEDERQEVVSDRHHPIDGHREASNVCDAPKEQRTSPQRPKLGAQLCDNAFEPSTAQPGLQITHRRGGGWGVRRVGP